MATETPRPDPGPGCVSAAGDGAAGGLCGRKTSELCCRLLANAVDGVMLTEVGGPVLAANDAACRILGRRHEDVIGLTAEELVDGSDARVPAAIEKRRQEGHYSGELRFLRGDGTSFPCEFTCAVFRDEEGKEFGAFVIRDISERKRMQELLEARFRLSEFSLTCSLDALLQRTLDEAEALTGSRIAFLHFFEADQQTLTLQCWSTNTLQTLCHAEGKGLHYNVHEAGVWVDCVRERRPVIHNDYASLPHRKGLPPGHAPVMRELVVPVLRSGRIVAILGVGNKPEPYEDHDVHTVQALASLAWDLVLRKQAEDDLQRSRLELQAIYENAPIMMCLLDSGRRVVYANRAFAEFVGRPPENLLHERACGVLGCLNALENEQGCGYGSACVHCTVRQAVVDAFISREARHDLEYRTVIRGNGEDRPMVFLASVAPIHVSGETHILLCLDDITEREQVTEELRLSREQLRALAANIEAAREEDRKHLAREIHDVLAQDLMRLKIDLSLLQQQLTADGPRVDLAPMSARTQEMSATVDGTLRDVQRMATALRPSVLDGLGLCAAVDWYVRDFEQRTGISCRLSIPEEEPVLDGDVATAAYRILQESLTNVVRHAHASSLRVEVTVDGTWLVLSVSDNGCGIRDEALRNPLSIGLVGMRERALLFGGHFAVTSTPGGGTTLVVRLPVARGEVQS